MFQMVIAGGVDNVIHVEVYVQAVFWEIQAITTAVALDDSFMARECPVTDAISDCKKIDIRTGIDTYQWLHEVCTTKLLQTPIVLGGAGAVVQID